MIKNFLYLFSIKTVKVGCVATHKHLELTEVVAIFNSAEATEDVLVLANSLASVTGVVELAFKCHEFLVVRIVNLGEVHVAAVAEHVRIVGVLHFVVVLLVLVFVIAVLLLVVFIFFLAPLVQEWRVTIIEDLLAVRSNLPKDVQELASALVSNFVAVHGLGGWGLLLRCRLLINLLHLFNGQIGHLGFLVLFLLSPGLLESLSPHCKRLGDHSWAVVRVKQGCHCVQQVLVLLKVLLLPDQMQLEASSDVRIFQLFICAQVLHQFLQHFIRTVCWLLHVFVRVVPTEVVVVLGIRVQRFHDLFFLLLGSRFILLCVIVGLFCVHSVNVVLSGTQSLAQLLEALFKEVTLFLKLIILIS